MCKLIVKDLSLSINNRVLFSDFNLSLEGGKIAGLYGPTGSGKTSLLNYLAGIESPEVSVKSEQVIRDFDGVSYVFQESALLEEQSVLKNVMLPVEKIYGKEEVGRRATQMLETLFLNQHINEKAGNLSGGEKQRTALARALVYPGQLILLDEPFHAQDQAKKEAIIKLINHITKKENRMTIVVSHDKSDFEKLGSNIFKLNT